MTEKAVKVQPWLELVVNLPQQKHKKAVLLGDCPFACSHSLTALQKHLFNKSFFMVGLFFYTKVREGQIPVRLKHRLTV